MPSNNRWIINATPAQNLATQGAIIEKVSIK